MAKILETNDLICKILHSKDLASVVRSLPRLSVLESKASLQNIAFAGLAGTCAAHDVKDRLPAPHFGRASGE